MSSVQPYFLDAQPSDRLLMRASVGANFAIIVFSAFYLAFEHERSGITGSLVLLALLVGYFLADFASGLVHWGLDTWFDERLLGRAVAIAREHHTHPQNIVGYGFTEHCTLGSAPSAVFVGPAVVATALCPLSIATYSAMILWFVIATCLFFGTSLHNLAHKRSRSRLVRAAQRLHLVVSAEHHWVHHRGDQVVRYCVVNGWANYACDALGVWRGLEWVVHALTGAEPRHDDLEWQRRYRETGTLARPPRSPAVKPATVRP